MEKKKRRWPKVVGWLAGVTGILAVSGTLWWQNQLNVLRHLKVPQERVATVFIPGYNSNSWTFSPMIQRFDRYGIATDAMTIQVASNGRLTVTQKARLNQRNPLINIIFADARNPEKQIGQLDTIMTRLYQDYGIHQVNLVGHSMGGFLAFRYLTHRQAGKQPAVKRFVNIASGGARDDSDFADTPRDLQVLAIGGDIWNMNSDWQVSLASVQHFVRQVKPLAASAKLSVIHGSPLTAYHSALHQNPVVDQQIARFLFR
ncbi:alpha/beta fold hydrolase [Schleiferilactobacillus perolens]|uniref:alpha/beta fold hydrolase n=1 Tax=Schleiferilactobacillus perolens TaxID=100468 RepID=UPI002355FAEC|nr:alpha/beta fold hydrolase [Schleiferilactobacillus perolens]MCI2171689.1 alpha/beta fold hydrolase [Schleiferilactobacillus perolens]